MFEVLKESMRPPTQTEQAPGTVKNNAGGYSYEVSRIKQLERFLILGVTGGTYYVGEKDLLKQNLDSIKELVSEDPQAALDLVIDVATNNRAANSDATIYVLALLVSQKKTKTVFSKTTHQDVKIEETSDVAKQAMDFMPKVLRTFTHLSHFVTFIRKGKLRGFGTGFQRALADCAFRLKSTDDIVHSLIKYQQRDGVSQRDLYRLTLPKKFDKVLDDERKNLFDSILYTGEKAVAPMHPRLVAAKKCLQATSSQEALGLMLDHHLPIETVPTELRDASIYRTAMDTNGLEWLLRNLGNLSAIGLTEAFSPETEQIVSKLKNTHLLKNSRIHPVTIMKALHQYGQGHGQKSSKVWTPNGKILSALERAFYESFNYVEPSGKNILIAVDTSGSMSGAQASNIPGMCVHEAAAIMAMVAAKVEPNHHIMAFDTAYHEVAIGPDSDLNSVVKAFSKYGGGTDTSLPFKYALDKKLHVDLFVCLTDSESWAGKRHAMEVFNEYRQKYNRSAKAINVAMCANRLSTLSGTDGGVLEICGFDTNVPTLISNFAKV